MSEDGKRKFLIPGVEVWKNPRNKFMVFQLHYSADEHKRNPLYRDTIKSAMPIKQYMQEYELAWDSYAGRPVYEDWNALIHGSQERIEPELGLPIIRGWDFGLTPAVVLCQYVEEQLRVLKEFTAVNMGITRFCDFAIPQMKQFYPRWHRQEDWIDMIDPAGFAKKDTNEDTCAAILSRKGLRPEPGPVVWETRRKSVEHFLTRQTKGVPCFRVDLAGCPIVARGFNGGYRYSENAFDKESKEVRPIKDEHSHPHDGLQYVAWKIQHWKRSMPTAIPAPAYSFSGSGKSLGASRRE